MNRQASVHPRPRHALPTDRLGLEAQRRVLCAIVLASDYGRNAVGGEEISRHAGVATSSAVLNNRFFVESNLITRESRGRYQPTEAANEFGHKYGYDKRRAGLVLGESLRGTWYFDAVRRLLTDSPATEERLLELLGHEAATGPLHRVRLAALIAWLRYAGLITFQSGVYKLPLGEREQGRAPSGTVPSTSRSGKILTLPIDLVLSEDDLGRLARGEARLVCHVVDGPRP
jgi:hypothetical protein